MPTFTVISRTDRIGDTTSLDPFAVVAGSVEVAGTSLHLAVVDAPDPDAAMRQVRDAARTMAGVPVQDHHNPLTYDGRWTVVGFVDRGVCPSWQVAAVIPGEHDIWGDYDSMLSLRWSAVVEASDARSAESAGWKAAGELFEDSWN